MHEFRTRRRIEFSDTDMGGIAHFSRFFVFMETAEHEFLNAIGTSVHVMVDGRIQVSGGPELALTLESRGYDWVRENDGEEVSAR